MFYNKIIVYYQVCGGPALIWRLHRAWTSRGYRKVSRRGLREIDSVPKTTNIEYFVFISLAGKIVYNYLLFVNLLLYN